MSTPRTESKSWRVSGIKRDGGRVRENFKELQAAQCRQIELESEWLVRKTETAVRATKLTDTQLRLAELAFIKLDADADLPLAVDYWLTHGKQNAVAESPRIDEAVEQFKAWLKTTGELRDRTKSNLRLRVGIFANSVPNMRVADITADTVFAYLENREIGKASKDNDRRALSRFFSWCMDRPRRWIKLNPARKEKRERRGTNGATPSILSLADCKALLEAAEAHKAGRLVPYIAVCLFGGLRPFEAARLTWQQVNPKDNEIRLEGQQTKTGSPRIVAICPTLRCWLKKYHKQKLKFYPSNWRRDFDSIKEAAGFCGRPTKESRT